MAVRKTKPEILKFRFTQDSFVVDDSKYEGKFFDDKISALYDIGFESKPVFFDEAGIFLWRISEMFISRLSKTEGLELSR